MIKRISQFFHNTWLRFQRYYVLKHNRAFRGRGVNEKYITVTLATRRAIKFLLLAIIAIAFAFLIIDSIHHGIGIGAQFHDWIKELLGMKIPATNPTK